MSIANQSTQQKFPYGYDEVFEAVVEAISEVDFNLKSQDKTIGRITASTGMSLFSWGENLTIVVERDGSNNTVVAIDSAMKLGTNVAGLQRHVKNFDQLIQAVSAKLRLKKPAVSETSASSLNLNQGGSTQQLVSLEISCPLCGKRLLFSIIKAGENKCPHCLGKYFAD